MKTKLVPFDVAEYLETSKDIIEFLKEVEATGDKSDLIHALNTAGRAKYISDIPVSNVWHDSCKK